MLNLYNRVLSKIERIRRIKQERDMWFRDFSHFNEYTKPVLTKEQKVQARNYFHKYDFDIRTEWHNYYTFMTGNFSEKYIPADLMYTVIVPYLNYMPFELAYQDKGIYNRLLPNVRQPKMIIQRIHGFYYCDGWNNPISEKDAIKICSNLNDVIIKPSVNSCQGQGVRLISTEEGHTKDGVDLKTLFSQYGENFVVQEKVKQCDFLSSLNSSSLNTMRILTLRKGNEIIILSTAIRIGGKGSITDNGYGGGFCTGIEADGSLKPHGYRLTTGEHIDKLQNGVTLKGLVIPNFEKVIDKAKELALTLPYLRLIGWDFTIDEEGEPVFIEMNTLPGIYIMQLCNGPVFGELTDELLNSVKSVKHSLQPRILRHYSNRDF